MQKMVSKAPVFEKPQDFETRVKKMGQSQASWTLVRILLRSPISEKTRDRLHAFRKGDSAAVAYVTSRLSSLDPDETLVRQFLDRLKADNEEDSKNITAFLQKHPKLGKETELLLKRLKVLLETTTQKDGHF